jgi:hypothetical protein
MQRGSSVLMVKMKMRQLLEDELQSRFCEIQGQQDE